MATKRTLIAPPNVRQPANAAPAPAPAATTQPAQRAPAAAPTGVTLNISRADLAGAVQDVLASRQAPAFVNDEARRGRWTRNDLDLLALDSGLPAERMAARQESIERGHRVQADERQGLARDDDGRAVDRRSLPSWVRVDGQGRVHVTKRQFRQMRRERNQRDDNLGEFGTLDGDVGMRISQWLAYMIAHEGNGRAAYAQAKRDGADFLVQRALGESTVAAGGALVPEVLVEDFIELLYNTSAYLQAGPIRLPAPGGNMSMPRMTSGAAVSWIGENANLAMSEEVFGQVRIDLKYLGAIVPMSNRLIRHSPFDAQGIVQQDLIDAVGVAVDAACIRGTGTASTVVGMKNQAQTSTPANATVNVANATQEMVALQTSLYNLKVKILRGAQFFSPRTRGWLMAARDGNNNRVWRDEMRGGTLEGLPFFVTQNIPINLGAGSNESEFYTVAMEHEIYAEGVGDDGLRVDARDGIAYHNGSTVVSAFSQDQTVVRILQGLDRTSRQGGNNIAMLTGLKYGV